MPTFSWRKNPLILANNFTKDFKSFESYLKHCINALKQINWFKTHQYDSNVSDFEYMQKFLNIESLDFFGFVGLSQHFNKNVLSKLDKSSLDTIKTNEYYYDNVSEFFDTLSNQSNDKLIEGKSENALTKSSDNKNYYQQLCHLVKTNQFKIDPNTSYTDEEIMNLVLNNKIYIFDSFVVPSLLSISDIQKKQNSGEIVFKARDFNGSVLGVSNCGDVTGYIEARNKQEKTDWIIKNLLKLHWVRNNAITFNSSDKDFVGYKLDKEFNMLYEHINLISDNVQKNYKKRKKPIPQNYLNLISEIKNKSREEKNKFENECKIINHANFEIIE